MRQGQDEAAWRGAVGFARAVPRGDESRSAGQGKSKRAGGTEANSPSTRVANNGFLTMIARTGTGGDRVIWQLRLLRLRILKEVF
jgi:hypothetical protein